MTKIRNYYVVCKYFNEGKCRDGYKCLYLHPDMECNLGKKCNKDICLKTHKDLCKFGKNCKKAAKCPYKHRKKLWEKCEYGEDCDYGWNCPFKPEKKTCVYKELCEYRESCPFKHPKKTCKNEDDCSLESCRYKHEKKTCLFGKSCKYGETCPYKEVKKPCKFKEKCRNGASCEYEHKERIDKPRAGDNTKMEENIANKLEVDTELDDKSDSIEHVIDLVEVHNDDEHIHCEDIVEKLDVVKPRKENCGKLFGYNLTDGKDIRSKNRSKSDYFGGFINNLGDKEAGMEKNSAIAEELVTEVKETFASIYKELEDLNNHMEVARKDPMRLELGEIVKSKEGRYIGGENGKQGENVGPRKVDKKNYLDDHGKLYRKDACVNEIRSEICVTDDVKDLKEIEQNLKEIMIGLDSSEKFEKYQTRLELIEQRLKLKDKKSGAMSVFKNYEANVGVNRDHGCRKGPGL